VVIDSSQRERIAELAKAIADKPALLSEAKTVAELRKKLAGILSPAAVGPAGSPQTPAGADGGGRATPVTPAEVPSVPSGDGRKQSAWAAFVKQVNSSSTASESREWPGPGTPVPLVSNISNTADLDWKGIKIILGGVEKAWQPKATPLSGGSGTEKGWMLTGQPGGDAEKTWGKIVVRDAQGEQPGKEKLVFIAEPDAPYICGFVPIMFEWSAAPAESRRTHRLQVAKRPQALAWKTRGAKTWSEVAGMAAGDPADAGGGQVPPRSSGEGTLEIQLEPWLAACSPQLVVSATIPASSSHGLTLRHNKLGKTVDLVFRSPDENLTGHPLVERFRCEEFRKDNQPLMVVVKSVDTKPWADRRGIEVPATRFHKLEDKKWRDIVRDVLMAHFGREFMETNKLVADEVSRRIGTANDKDDPANSPWTTAKKKENQSLANWKQMAVDYVADPSRRFAMRNPSENMQGADIKQMALDPGCVAGFLDAEADWVAEVRKSFSNPNVKKAEQNELIALLVLANLDRMIVAKTDPEGVRQAFAVPISECFRATLEVTWAIEGEDPLRVPVATVSAAQKQP
jgi:hypothetical protein